MAVKNDREATRKVVPTTIEQLKRMGFEEASSEVKNKRGVINIEGLDKTGKTDLALTGKSPILYFDIDVGGEDVVEKFKSFGKDIFVYRMRISKEGESQETWEEQWDELNERALAAWGLPEGTVVFDTWGECYELARLARLGRLEQVPPLRYTKVNKEMLRLIHLAYQSRMTTVFLHKMKPIYVNDKRTNNYELAGWGDTTYEVKMNLRTFCEVDGEDGTTVYKVLVRNCRGNAAMANKTYECGKAGDGLSERKYTLERLVDMMYARPRKLKLDDDEGGEEKGEKGESKKKSRKLVLEED